MDNKNKELSSVLLIDDDHDDYDLVLEAFREINPDIRVFFLSRCEEAVRYSQQSFDLVLLDINMPHHDGFSWLKGIREKGYDKLPVIMFTNSSSPADIIKSYNEGANLYFPKPESYSKLKTALRKLIQLDWTDPFSITARYTQNGRYTTFKAE